MISSFRVFGMKNEETICVKHETQHDYIGDLLTGRFFGDVRLLLKFSRGYEIDSIITMLKNIGEVDMPIHQKPNLLLQGFLDGEVSGEITDIENVENFVTNQNYSSVYLNFSLYNQKDVDFWIDTLKKLKSCFNKEDAKRAIPKPNRDIMESIEPLLDMDNERIKSLYNSWDMGDCSEVGLVEILLFQLIQKHKADNGEHYDKDYDLIKLRYTEDGKTS